MNYMKTAAAMTVAALAGLVVRAALGVRSAIGAPATAVQPYAAGTLNYRNRQFHNTEAGTLVAPSPGLVREAVRQRNVGRPPAPVPMSTPLAPVDAAELALTWYGHASALLEIDGHRVLFDPVWGRRVSPSTLMGPARLHPVPVALEAVPRLDAVVISHDHYDHLDKATVVRLARARDVVFVVPVGVGAHLRRWRVPDARIVELDWGASTTVGSVTVTCTEARHFSGRGLTRNTTLWSSWVVTGPTRRAYFGGDTGYGRFFTEIGSAHGPFDLTLLPIGAYDSHWPDIHVTPEEAVTAHADLCADPGHGVLVPIHWATFNLAFHPWAEPPRRLLAAADSVGSAVSVPRPGQRLDALAGPVREPWWDLESR